MCRSMARIRRKREVALAMRKVTWPLSTQGPSRDASYQGAWKRAVLAGKELLQHRSQDSRNDIVRLTFQGAVLGIGKGICECLRGRAHPRLAVSAAYHERGDRDGRQLLGQHWHVTQKSSFIDERVRTVFECRSEWRLSQLGNDFSGNAHHLRLVEFDRITSAP